MRPVDFLYKAWSHVAQDGDYVFLCTRKPDGKKGWSDSAFKFDSSIRGKVRDWLRRNDASVLDVYFCPLPFKEPERLAKHVKPVNLLWSDVDDGDPTKLRPSVLWESSPGRHHALWMLDKRLHADDASLLNKSVTYHLGADKGGWDLSQVLRIPGTFNHKYESKPEVKLVHWDEALLKPEIVAKKAKHNLRKVEEVEVAGEAGEILKNYRLSSRVLELLHGEAEVGRRSEVLWYLENKLSEAGMSPEEIIAVVKESEWNKFKGRHDEDSRLRTELSKVIEKQIDQAPKKPKAQVPVGDMRIQSFSEVMASLETNPGWQVPGFWMKASHGIVAGEPKSFKSTLVMDLMMSVASGAPFLGKFPVEETGDVLYIQNENAEWIMKDRFEKMLLNKGLVGKVSYQNTSTKIKVKFAPDVPLYMINQQGFMLTDPDQQEFLEETIKQMKPALVVLDPLYLMFDGDIASAQELFPVLQWLLYLKNEYKCGIMLIHHWNKGGDSKRGGQRMLGSTTLHGWIESAWYLKSMPADEGGEAEVVMEREFRGAGLHQKLDIRIQMGDMGDPTYKVTVDDYHGEEANNGAPKRSSPETMMSDVMSVVGNRKGCSEAYISGNTGYNAKQLREIIDLMISKDLCYRDSGKIYLKEEEEA